MTTTGIKVRSYLNIVFFLALRAAKSLIGAVKSKALTVSLSNDSIVKRLSLSCPIVERSLFLTNPSFEKDRSPEALVTGRVK